MGNIWPYNSIPMSVLQGRLPTGEWGTPHYSQTATEERQLDGAIVYIKHWEPRLGTNSPLLVYALCVIFPTGHWGTPHYPPPATEEWLYLTAIWGAQNELNIENHLGGPDVLFRD